MAKISKEEEARRSGMLYAFKVVQEGGIEALEKEIKFRNITKAPLAISMQQATEFLEDDKRNCTVTYLLMSLMTLHDEFGFNKVRLDRFMKRFMLKTDCLVEGYTDWAEQQKIILDECKMKIDLPKEFLEMKKKLEV